MEDTSAIGELYQEIILDHYRRPRNKGTMEAPTVSVQLRNPTCGDEIVLQLLVEDGKIADVKYSGQGCSISQASASMMTALIKNKTLAEADALAHRFDDMMRDRLPKNEMKVLGELRALEGVKKFPARYRCAMLGWNALEECSGKMKN